MGFRPFTASYETGRELVRAGIPLDFLDALPRETELLRKTYYVAQLGGYGASKIIDLNDHQVRYVIALELRTERPSGIVISDWSFSSPWGHHITWDYHPFDLIPITEHGSYRKLFNSRILDVLNDGCLLSRGRPVKGLLCGSAAFESLPETIRSGATVEAKLTLTDDHGDVVEKTLRFMVDRKIARTQAHTRRRKIPPLFSQRDDPAARRLRDDLRARARPVPRAEEFVPESMAVAAD